MSTVKYVTSAAFSHFWSNMETHVLPKYIEKSESGVQAGTYASVTVNEHGIVTAGTQKGTAVISITLTNYPNVPPAYATVTVG